MKDWHKLNQQLFKKQLYFLPGCDSYDEFFLGTTKNKAVVEPL